MWLIAALIQKPSSNSLVAFFIACTSPFCLDLNAEASKNKKKELMSLAAKPPRLHILGPGGNAFSPSHTNSKVRKKDVVLLVKKRNDRNKPVGVVESAPNHTLPIENSPKNSYSETTRCCEQGQDDASTESLCSSDSSSAKKSPSSRMRVIKRNGTNLRTAVPEKPLSQGPAAVKRCNWITPHSGLFVINSYL